MNHDTQDMAAFDASSDDAMDSRMGHAVAVAPMAAAAEPVTAFDGLGLPGALIKALTDSGYTSPTDVQTRAIPAAMNGADLLVASSTGSGKTAAFMLPALARIAAARGDGKRREKGMVHGPRILVLAPTRELALQVSKAASTYGRHLQGLRVATIVGGVPYGYQLKALRGPLDVLIATPGRLLDHLQSGAAVLGGLEMLILDEADRMLDMGFIEDIETIAQQTPENRQTLMFSATFAGHVGKLAQRLTRDAVSIEVTSHTDSHDNIEQRLHLADTLAHKNDLLDHLLTTREVNQAVVFTSTQRDADILADRLADMGHAVASLHGGMPQGRRNRVLQGLRMGELRVLVATDVAARGIDVPTITHVINYGMPMKPEDYVHRIGRTGRAGRSGLAVTIAERRDIPMLRRIERFTTHRIPESVIEGLEPRTKMQAERPTGGRPGGHKPAPGQRGRRDDRFAPRSFGNDRGGDRGGERQDRNEGGDRFGGQRFSNEPRAASQDRAPRDNRFAADPRDVRFAPAERDHDERPRKPGASTPPWHKPAGGAGQPFHAKPRTGAGAGAPKGFGGGQGHGKPARGPGGPGAPKGKFPSFGRRDG
jgi:superfamily II DNA/RNA helicase